MSRTARNRGISCSSLETGFGASPKAEVFWYNIPDMTEEDSEVKVKVPKLAMALTAIAWFWTAYECDTIGIDVFDMLLKRFPGQVWIMAAVLT